MSELLDVIPLEAGIPTSASQNADEKNVLLPNEQQVEMCREVVRSKLTTNVKGEISKTIANFVKVFQEDPILKGAICWNELTERVDITHDLGWKRASTAFTDTDQHYLELYVEQHYGLSGEKKLLSALAVVANENHFHPIRNQLNSLSWDGTPRLRSCLRHFLGAAEDDYTEEVLKHFMLGAILRVFYPGSKYEEILCLVGGQGIGKSTFFRFLALEDEWFSDDIRKLDDEKVYPRLQGHWMIELSEMLATNNAKSVEESRSFFSRQKDTYRTPYEKQPRDHLRQCVFAGTSNSMDFLPLDRAGNRRFLPVLCEVTEPETHILANEAESRAYIRQMWAEAMAIFRSENYSMTFSPAIRAELLKTQRDFMPEDTEAGMILEFLSHTDCDKVCCMQLHQDALHRMGEPKKWESHAYSEIMRNYAPEWVHFENPRSFGPGFGRQKGWARPADDAERKQLSGNQVTGNQLTFIQIPNETAVAEGMPEEWIA